MKVRESWAGLRSLGIRAGSNLLWRAPPFCDNSDQLRISYTLELSYKEPRLALRWVQANFKHAAFFVDLLFYFCSFQRGPRVPASRSWFVRTVCLKLPKLLTFTLQSLGIRVSMIRRCAKTTRALTTYSVWFVASLHYLTQRPDPLFRFLLF